MRMRLIILCSIFLFTQVHDVMAMDVWPSNPLKIIVPFPPGGAPDILARLLAGEWQRTYKISVLVENEPGAGGNIGARSVAKSLPDGRTILLGSVGTQSMNPYLYPSSTFSAEKELKPVAFLASTPNVIVINPEIPVHDLQELISYAKSHPITYGTSGIGTSLHLSGELLQDKASITLTHIPYKGRAQSLPDVLTGRTMMLIDNLSSSLSYIQRGELRAIAVTSAQRSPIAPQIPSIAESGIPDFEATSWFALYVPTGTSEEVSLEILNASNRVMQAPEIQKILHPQGLDTQALSMKKLLKFTDDEKKKWLDILQKIHLVPN